MNFVFHELIQLSSVINKSEREGGSFEAGQTKRSSYVRFMYVWTYWSKADDNQQENPGSSKQK